MESAQQQTETTGAKKEWQAPELITISKSDVQGGNGPRVDALSSS